MNVMKWIRIAVTSILLLIATSISPVVQAAEAKSISDESIYDLLVDRYFNQGIKNDYDVNAKDPNAFAGGDILGVNEKLDHIAKMGFTVLSIGPVFSTKTYDGKQVLDYSVLDRHFGTDEEFKQLINNVHKKNMKLMVDFPVNGVSEDHVWTKEQKFQNAYKKVGNGTIQWDLTNKDLQNAMIEAATKFVQTYKVDGIRLTNIGDENTTFVNDMISALKKDQPNLYVISNEKSGANFDAAYSSGMIEEYQSIFKGLDRDSSALLKPINSSLEKNMKPSLLMVDDFNSARMTYAADKENMFPPTRIKLAMAAMLTLPGVPQMQYGTEIAINGEKAPESLSVMDFKTKEDIIDFISDLQSIRNKSEALRNGEFTLLHNENGLLAYKRSLGDETWIVVINNTSGTKKITLNSEIVGKDRELRGVFAGDIVRAKEDDEYRVVVDREVAEVYQVTEKRGLNISYLIALGLVYVLFVAFIIAVLKKSRKNKASK